MEKKISTIIAISLLVLAIGLFFGFVSNSHAVNINQENTGVPKQKIQQYQSMVSTSTVLKYSETLLNRSTVARKLKFSSHHADTTRYAEAIKIYQDAHKAYKDGNDTKAKRLAVESIRVIARSVPRSQNYSQLARLPILGQKPKSSALH